MERHSEFPIFFQSAMALVGFLVLISLFTWAFESKSNLHTASASNAQVSVIR